MFNGKFVLLLCGFLFAGVVLAEEMCGICKRAKGVHLAADRKDSPYRVAFEDPLYQKLKKALKNHVWFAGMLHGNLREGESFVSGETCDARWYFEHGCCISDGYTFITVAVVDDYVELHQYMSWNNDLEYSGLSYCTDAFMRLNQLTKWGHFKVDEATQAVYYVCRLPRKLFESDFDYAVKTLVMADEAVRRAGKIVLFQVSEGYTPRHAMEMILEECEDSAREKERIKPVNPRSKALSPSFHEC